jgi:hypothetical protein
MKYGARAQQRAVEPLEKKKKEIAHNQVEIIVFPKYQLIM